MPNQPFQRGRLRDTEVAYVTRKRRKRIMLFDWRLSGQQNHKRRPDFTSNLTGTSYTVLRESTMQVPMA